MAKGGSSARWRQRQAADPYVRRAQAEGWRSRAVFKLMEIQARDPVLRPGQVVVDLGAAPGAWSQYACSIVGERGRIVAVDLLPFDPLPGVMDIRGDFADETTLQRLLELTGKGSVDLVLSDLAPNISGNRSVDQPRAMHLAELALDFAGRALRPGGDFVSKVFHGEGFDEFVRACRQGFETVKARKPDASRQESRETYLVARTCRM